LTPPAPHAASAPVGGSISAADAGMGLIDRLIDGLDACARFVAGILTAAIVLILLAQVGFRYLLNSSILWSEEVSTWCMVWVVFIGSASLMRAWDHVHIPLLIRIMPLRLRPVFIIAARLVTAGTACVIAWYGIAMVMGTFHMRSQTTGIDSRWIKIAVPAGIAAMALFALRCLLEDVRHWRSGDFEYFRKYGEIVPTEEAVPAAAPASRAGGD
jgi:TRAP-type C4-dicarboxylate transport system permease small subunit